MVYRAVILLSYAILILPVLGVIVLADFFGWDPGNLIGLYFLFFTFPLGIMCGLIGMHIAQKHGDSFWTMAGRIAAFLPFVLFFVPIIGGIVRALLGLVI